MAGQDYSPSGTFPTFPVTLPKDGEVYNFDSIMYSVNPKRGLICKLIDAVGYLKNSLAGILDSINEWTGANTFEDITVTTGSHYKLSSRSVTRVQQAPLVNANGTVAGAGFIDVAAGEYVNQPLMLPHGSVLTSVSIRLHTGFHSSLPQFMPKLKVSKQNMLTEAITQIGIVTDASPDTTTYNAAHQLTISSLNETIDRSVNYYFIEYDHESGSNSGSGTLLSSRTTVTVTSLDDCY